MTLLAEACDDLATWLPHAQQLITEPDTDGTSTGGKPGSRPPWNPAAANAYYDAHATIRDILQEFQQIVTGKPSPRRGWSDGNTRHALTLIGNLSYAAPEEHIRGKKPCPCAHCHGTRRLEASVSAICQLAAIDKVEPWANLRPDPDGLPALCPWCQTPSLRVQVRNRKVRCFLPSCVDDEGNRREALMDIGAASGEALLVWQDGTVQVAP